MQTKVVNFQIQKDSYNYIYTRVIIIKQHSQTIICPNKDNYNMMFVNGDTIYSQRINGVILL